MSVGRSVCLSILTFDFDLILESYLIFWGPNGLILGSGYSSKTVFGSPHIDKQLLFYKYCSISALLCSFEFVWWWVVSQRILSLNPPQVLINLLLGLGCGWAVSIKGLLSSVTIGATVYYSYYTELYFTLKGCINLFSSLLVKKIFEVIEAIVSLLKQHKLFVQYSINTNTYTAVMTIYANVIQNIGANGFSSLSRLCSS